MDVAAYEWAPSIRPQCGAGVKRTSVRVCVRTWGCWRSTPCLFSAWKKTVVFIGSGVLDDISGLKHKLKHWQFLSVGWSSSSLVFPTDMMRNWQRRSAANKAVVCNTFFLKQCFLVLVGIKCTSMQWRRHSLLSCLTLSATLSPFKPISCSLLWCEVSTTNCDCLHNESGVNFIFTFSACLWQAYLIISLSACLRGLRGISVMSSSFLRATTHDYKVEGKWICSFAHENVLLVVFKGWGKKRQCLMENIFCNKLGSLPSFYDVFLNCYDTFVLLSSILLLPLTGKWSFVNITQVDILATEIIEWEGTGIVVKRWDGIKNEVQSLRYIKRRSWILKILSQHQ